MGIGREKGRGFGLEWGDVICSGDERASFLHEVFVAGRPVMFFIAECQRPASSYVIAATSDNRLCSRGSVLFLWWGVQCLQLL